MAITVSASSTQTQLPPSGTFIGRCYSVVDIGTHNSEYNGKPRAVRKVRLSFELPDELMENGKPFVISKEFRLSLHPKANLRKQLESWRGRPFTDEELNGFNLAALLGAVALLNITHEKRRDGTGLYGSLVAITKPMRGQQCPPPVNPSVEYSIDQGQNATFAALPEWLRKKISECAEWKLPAPAPGDNPTDPAPGANAESAEGEDDDCPF